MAAPNVVTSPITIAGLYASKTAGIGLHKAFFPVVLAGLAGTAKVVDNFAFGAKGSLVKIEFVCTVPASTASKAATITPSLGGTNVTGGVLALTTANCTAGAVVAGTAITALNTFVAATLFDLTLSGVTAFSEGSGVIVVTYTNEDMREFLAKNALLQ